MAKRTILILGMIAVLLFAIVSAPCAAETLSLLTWKGYAPQSLVEKFQKETGITVNVTYSNNEEMIAKLRATRGAGFDLAQPSQDRISSVQEKYQIYQPIDLSKIKTEQIIPSMLEAVKLNTMANVKPHAVPFCWGTSGLIVNRKYAAEATDYMDLLNEKYKGRVSYRLKRPTLIAVAFAMGDNPFAKYSDVNAYQALMEKVGQALIDGKAVVKNYWTNGDALLQSMQSEEVYLAMAWDNGGWKLHVDNSDIDFFCHRVPHSLEFHGFDDTQQAELGLRRNITDFIQKKGPAIGQLKTTDFVLGGPRECLRCVAEQFIFQQAFGQCTTIEFHQRAVPALSTLVQGVDNKFFSRAAFAN